MTQPATAPRAYTRQNPSPRYTELLTMYQSMHAQGAQHLDMKPEETFTGQSLIPQVTRIRELCERTGAKTLLDYGCGKAMVYRATPITIEGVGEFRDIGHFWGVEEVALYDPAYQPYSVLPDKKFDGVICTDVLEHCPEEDLDWIIGGLFEFSNKFVFANIACYPARKTLPNGENAHCTVQPLEWWQDKIGAIAMRYPHVKFDFVLSVPNGQGGLKEITLRNY